MHLDVFTFKLIYNYYFHTLNTTNPKNFVTYLGEIDSWYLFYHCIASPIRIYVQVVEENID